VSATIWRKKTIRGVTYDLSHLNPFLLDVLPGDKKAKAYKVAVSFDLHTFTRERLPADTPDLFMGQNGDPRSFCFQRYDCSQYLPDLIRRAAAGKVYFTYDRKFLTMDNIPSVSGEYAAIFRLEQAVSAGIDVRMFVISAHERRNPLGRMEAIQFYTLVRKIAGDEEIPWPKKK
jgi:hypothetical protein